MIPVAPSGTITQPLCSQKKKPSRVSYDFPQQIFFVSLRVVKAFWSCLDTLIYQSRNERNKWQETLQIKGSDREKCHQVKVHDFLLCIKKEQFQIRPSIFQVYFISILHLSQNFSSFPDNFSCFHFKLQSKNLSQSFGLIQGYNIVAKW